MNRDEKLLSAYASHSYEISISLGHLLYHAVSLRALGILDWLYHDYPQAEARLRESYLLFQQLGTRWQIGRTLFDLGELSISMGKIEEAKESFSRALSFFVAMDVHTSKTKTQEYLDYLNELTDHKSPL